MLDTDTFQEIAPYITHRHGDFGLDQQRYAGDGVVTGLGLVDGRRIAVFAQDFTILGGSFSEVQALKIGRLLAVVLYRLEAARFVRPRERQPRTRPFPLPGATMQPPPDPAKS